MEATFAAKTFSNLEEIGPRLQLRRSVIGMNVSRVAAKAGQNYITVVTVESGNSSPETIEKTAAAVGADISLTVTDKAGVASMVKLSGLQKFLKDTRLARNLTLSDVARIAGVQPSSVSVFENSNRPLIRSVKRYLEAYELTAEIAIMVDGVEYATSTATVASVTRAQEGLVKASTTYGIFENNFVTPIGAALAVRRSELGMSKTEICSRLNTAFQTVARIEQGHGSLESLTKYAVAVGMTLTLTLEDANGDVTNTTPDEIASKLDTMRQKKGHSIAEMARIMGTTYRAVKIFPTSVKNQVHSVERYATALGLTIGHKLEIV